MRFERIVPIITGNVRYGFLMGRMESRSRFGCGVMGLAISLLLCSEFAIAQGAEKKSTFGIWSVYCGREAAPSLSSCAMVASVISDKNTSLWAKVGFTIASARTGSLEMTIRTPNLDSIRDGVSVGFDGRQSGTAPFDRCRAFCETTVALTDKFVSHLGLRKNLTVEYQVGERDGIILPFNLEDFLLAWSNLQVMAGVTLAAVKDLNLQESNFRGDGLDGTLNFTVERRKKDSKTTESVNLVAPTRCNGKTGTFQALVGFNGSNPSEEKVHVVVDNGTEFASWVKDCNPGSFYRVVPTNFDVNQGKPSTQKVEQLGLLTVVNFVKGNGVSIDDIVYSKSEKSRKLEGASRDSSVPPWWPIATAKQRLEDFE